MASPSNDTKGSSANLKLLRNGSQTSQIKEKAVAIYFLANNLITSHFYWKREIEKEEKRNRINSLESLPCCNYLQYPGKYLLKRSCIKPFNFTKKGIYRNWFPVKFLKHLFS